MKFKRKEGHCLSHCRVLFLMLTGMLLLALALPAQAQSGKGKKGKVPGSKLTPEQKDLKMTASYLTDGRKFTDDEIIELSRILKKIEFKKEWKQIKNKAEGNYPLTKHEKRIYRKMLRRQDKVRHELNKYWEKKNRPKGKKELKQYKEAKKRSDKWNRKKAKN